MQRRNAVALLLALCLQQALTETVQQAIQRITTNSSKSTRPGIANAVAGPDIVEVQFYVEKMHVLQMRDFTFGFDGYMRAWWKDERLTFDAATSPQLKLSREEADNLWKPVLYWEGAKNIELPSAKPDLGELFWIYPDGRVLWSRQLRMSLSCDFAGGSLDSLPFDQHNCPFKMGMYSDTADEVFVKWKEGEVALENWQGACLAEFHATALQQESQHTVYSSGSYTYAFATISFARTPNLWISSYFMPAVALVCVSYLGFYIDPEVTPARVTLGLVTLLIVMTNFISLTAKLPTTVNPPWLSRFCVASFVFNLVAMVEQIMVSFGNNLKKWLDAQRAEIERFEPWKDRLGKMRMEDLIQDLNVDLRKGVSKKDFKRGIIETLGSSVPAADIANLFESFDRNRNDWLSLESLETLHQSLKSSALTAAQRSFASEPGSPPGLPPKPQPQESWPADGQDARNGSGPERREETVEEKPSFMNPFAGAFLAAEPPTPSMALAPPVVPDEARPVSVEDGLRQRNVGPTGSAAKVHGGRNDKMWAAAAKARRAKTKAAFRKAAQEELGHNRTWTLKTFYIFPYLQNLRYLDFVFRVVFPLAYVIYLLYALSEVGFGVAHYDLLETAPCFRKA